MKKYVICSNGNLLKYIMENLPQGADTAHVLWAS